MSENEIIEIIEKIQCEYKEQENEKKYNDYTVFKAKEYSKGLQGLLDLYNKEKEKNENLELCLKAEEKYSEGLNRDIKSLLNIEPNDNFISKDKIKEKIEDYAEKSKYPLVNAKSRREYTFGIKALQELLEERN